MTVDELVSEAHFTAKEKGWWDSPRRPLEIHALIHSEIAEATEAVRERNETNECEELVDAIIRIADYAGFKGWDLSEMLHMKLEYNKTRTYRHGGKAL